MTEKDYDKIGRNEMCPCGSGKKHKYCHLRILQEMERFACMEKYHLEREKDELAKKDIPTKTQ